MWGKSGAAELTSRFCVRCSECGFARPEEQDRPMAWFEYDSKSGFFRVRFRYPPKGGRKYNPSKTLKITDEGKAHAKCELVEETIRLLERGVIKVPEGIDPGEFIVSGGTLTAKPVVE